MILKGKIVLPVLNVGPPSIYPLLSFLTCSTGTTGLPKKKKVVVLLPASFLYAFFFGLLPLFFHHVQYSGGFLFFYFLLKMFRLLSFIIAPDFVIFCTYQSVIFYHAISLSQTHTHSHVRTRARAHTHTPVKNGL